MARSGSHNRRRVVWKLRATALGVVFASAFYLLLIDTVDRPELYAGAGVILIAALIFEAARAHGAAEPSLRAGWLGPAWRLFARVPADVVRVSAATLAQLVHRRARRGVLRAIPFRHGSVEGQRDIGRRALAQALGSLGPNTIVIGIDRERDLLLVHQLRRSGDADSIDLLRVR